MFYSMLRGSNQIYFNRDSTLIYASVTHKNLFAIKCKITFLNMEMTMLERRKNCNFFNYSDSKTFHPIFRCFDSVIKLATIYWNSRTFDPQGTTQLSRLVPCCTIWCAINNDVSHFWPSRIGWDRYHTARQLHAGLCLLLNTVLALNSTRGQSNHADFHRYRDKG